MGKQSQWRACLAPQEPWEVEVWEREPAEEDQEVRELLSVHILNSQHADSCDVPDWLYFLPGNPT